MLPVVNSDGKGFYLLGETEVTEGLYYAVMDGVTTTPNKPIANVYYETFKSFVLKLATQTSLPFRFPTRSEWLYAARGGAKSLNYTYCGGNTLDDVAWYSGNTSTVQNVKQKQPNELGFYDMSGNVAEFTSTIHSTSWYHSYYYCGGSYKSEASAVEKTSSSYKQVDNDFVDPGVGLRLALTLN